MILLPPFIIRIDMTHRILFVVIAILVAFSPIAAFSMQDDWLQFRGPLGNGHAATAKNIPVRWSEKESVAWKTEIPGRGWSSPVISENTIWMTTAVEEKLTDEEIAERKKGVRMANQLSFLKSATLYAICVDQDSGKIAHKVKLFEMKDPSPIHSMNSFASPTPVIAGDRVFCHFGPFGTACLNRKSGKILWKINRFQFETQNGPGASPVPFNNLLIFNCDGTDKQFIVALDQGTGETAWKTERSGKLHEKTDFKKAYCTPVLANVNGKTQLISPAADWVYGYDPATGKEIWKANYGKLGFSTVPKPIFDSGKVYVLTSFMKSRLLAIKTDGKGDVTSTHVDWVAEKNLPAKPSMILVDGKLYGTEDRTGILTCTDAESGKQLWRTRIDGQYAASPIYVGGKIYFFNMSGMTTVIEPGDEFKLVGTNKLESSIMASPAIVNDAMYLRTEKALYCLKK